MSNLSASRLTLLHADSGVGKSSLLRAGVAARLEEIARIKFAYGDRIDVPVVFSSWRDDPIKELIGEIERTVNSYKSDGAVELPRLSLTYAISEAVTALDLAAAANRAATRPPGSAGLDEDDRPSSTLLIILDQFEEYFLYGSREIRGRLADELAAAIRKPALGANFLISIREDSFAALGNLLRGRISNVYGNDLHLDYLDSKSAREAVEYPVDRYNQLHPDHWVEIEAGLVDALLSEVRREQNGDRAARAGSDGQVPAGALPADADEHDGQVVTPYLQLVMTKLWDHDHQSGELRLRTLEELHGAKGIVADHLDVALSSLQEKDDDIAIESLHHLVTPGATKIALEVGELAAYIDRPVEEVAPVLKTLAGDPHILRTVPPAPGKSPDDPANQRFEIYHDVLGGPFNRAVSASAVEREKGRTTRARRFAAGALVLALAAVAAAIIAVVAREDSSTQKRAAQSGQPAASAESELSANPELSTLLALRAAERLLLRHHQRRGGVRERADRRAGQDRRHQFAGRLTGLTRRHSGRAHRRHSGAQLRQPMEWILCGSIARMRRV